MASSSLRLDSLNPEQREAVTHPGGPLLVLAGAGSGKTRVVTTRIAWLTQAGGIPAGRILALTFTNKAAREMAERVAGLAARSTEKPFIGTFHSFGVQLLRRHIPRLGYRPDFTIYDQGDQLGIVREVLGELPEQSWFTPQNALYALQKAKGQGQRPEEFLQRQDLPADVLLGTIWREYERVLRGMNAIDFEDILQLSLRLCREHPDATRAFFSRYEHALVDEYQDTNAIQHALLREIAGPHRNICAVGDDDQSIYGWRGAEPGHILSFEREFPGARVIRLERNYRSTDAILSAANQVIERNRERKGKTLRGTRGPGKALEWLVGTDERDELEKVITHLKLTRMRGTAPWGSFAILYRSNHQSRAIEEILREEAIPYWLVGGTRFYDRKEVKDGIAYLRLVHNPLDEASLFRIVNFPGRGIGRTTQTKLIELARAANRPCIELMREAPSLGAFTAPAAESLRRLAELLDRYKTRFAAEPLGECFRALLAELGFHRAVEKDKDDAKAKEAALSLVLELEQGTDHFARQNPAADLAAYLERIALYSLPEENEGPEGVNQVRLMTVHGAKGLEFPQVYLVGMADEVFPHKRALDEGGEAEERRLAYVAITRAQNQLVLSMAQARKRYGVVIPQQPSRFVLEIEPGLFAGVPPHADGQATQPIKAEKKKEAKGRFFELVRGMGG
jgi:superfamily I DNA/RNA helicase